MKKKIIIALFVGAVLMSGVAFAEDATTTNLNTTTTTSTIVGNVPACPTFVPVNLEQFRASCVVGGGRVVDRVSKAGCQMPPVCEKQIVRKPELNINPEGRFIGRALIVKSVSSTTLVAEVWGTSWTIDFSNVKNVIYKDGSERKVDTVATQVLPGQEISVLGRISKDRPGIVVAEVLRNYNQTEVIAPIKGTPLWDKFDKKIDNLENVLENSSKRVEGSAQQKIQEMLKQLQELQNKLKNTR